MKNKEKLVQPLELLKKEKAKNERMKMQLDKKNKDIDLMFYNITHDLKGPLATLNGLINIANREITDPVSLKYMDMLNKSFKRLESIVTNLIGALRLSRSKMQVSRIYFINMVNDVIGGYRHIEAYKDIDFKVRISYTNDFMSDDKLIRTIIQNLIDNAVKYSRGSNGNRHVTVTVKNGTNKHNLIIQVSDNGIGIESKYISRIFEMFFRASQQSKGTGMGLYLVKSAVDALCGTINVKSKRGNGTIFTIVLPRKATPCIGNQQKKLKDEN